VDAHLLAPLARTFDDALRAAGAEASERRRRDAFGELARRHAEPGRHYHTLRHIADALRAARVLVARGRGPGAGEPAPACVLALFFHDAVYDTRASDNEDRSALLATEALAVLDTPGPVIAAVARMVRATAEHISSAPDEALVNDADLRMLARSAAAYDVYSRRIRREYAWVPDEQWTAGRAQVLRRLLERPLYVTPWAVRHWEAPARANIRRELALLAAGAAGAGHERTGHDRTGHDRTGHDRTGQDGAGHDGTDQRRHDT